MACKILTYCKLIQALGLSKRLCSNNVKAAGIVTEPDYLKFLKPTVPVYENIDIQIKGYDYTIIEHYAKHVHKIAMNMDIAVEDAWATPHQALHITNREPNSSKIAYNYYLQWYERNIQISSLPAYSASNFFEVIQSFLPAGVRVFIHPHEKAHDEIRYIPDFELIELKKQLTEMQSTIDPSTALEADSSSKPKK